MTDHQFYVVWGEALKDSDRDCFVSDWSLSSLFLTDEEQQVPDWLPEQLGRIWDAAHLSIRDIRKHQGLTQAAFAKRYFIPKRTVENWESRGGYPEYVHLLLCRAVGLI